MMTHGYEERHIYKWTRRKGERMEYAERHNNDEQLGSVFGVDSTMYHYSLDTNTLNDETYAELPAHSDRTKFELPARCPAVDD